MIEKNEHYEDLIRWTIANYNDLLNIDRKKYKLDNLMMDIMSLDVHGVIKNNNDFKNFIADLKERSRISLK